MIGKAVGTLAGPKKVISKKTHKMTINASEIAILISLMNDIEKSGIILNLYEKLIKTLRRLEKQ